MDYFVHNSHIIRALISNDTRIQIIYLIQSIIRTLLAFYNNNNNNNIHQPAAATNKWEETHLLCWSKSEEKESKYLYFVVWGIKLTAFLSSPMKIHMRGKLVGILNFSYLKIQTFFCIHCQIFFCFN